MRFHFAASRFSSILPRMLVVAILACACGSEKPAAPEQAADLERGPIGKADSFGTCKAGDSNYCGGKSDGNCWCDDLCADYDDCCPDLAEVCDAGDESCAPDEYVGRGESEGPWVVSCLVDDSQVYERLIEAKHPTEDCPYRFALLGNTYPTKELAMSSNNCDSSCFYTWSYSVWVDRCGRSEDIKAFQVKPEGWLPLDPIPPVPGCPDLFLSPVSHNYYESLEAVSEAPCPDPQ